MSCSKLFRQICDGSVSVCDLSQEDLCREYECLSRPQQELLLGMLARCVTIEGPIDVTTIDNEIVTFETCMENENGVQFTRQVRICYQGCVEQSRTTHWINRETGAETNTPPAGTLVPCSDNTCLSRNWDPVCIDGEQWYVSESSECEGEPLSRQYRRGLDGEITEEQPTFTESYAGYCRAERPTCPTCRTL